VTLISLHQVGSDAISASQVGRDCSKQRSLAAGMGRMHVPRAAQPVHRQWLPLAPVALWHSATWQLSCRSQVQ
jgi:hypothetical protein